jgi:hypothetical protein
MRRRRGRKRHEVVKLLLLQGAQIEKLNKDNKNCLDIAISRGQKEVIRVLLDDKNWSKLFRTDSNDQRRLGITDPDALSGLADTDLDMKNAEAYQVSVSKDKPKENPQLVALLDAKMWEMLKIILDKSLLKNEFTGESTARRFALSRQHHKQLQSDYTTFVKNRQIGAKNKHKTVFETMAELTPELHTQSQNL